MSNIMSDSIFHECMRWVVTCSVFFTCLFFCCFFFIIIYLLSVFFFCGVILLFSSGWKRWSQFYHYNISGHGKILKYNGLMQMGLSSLEWDLMSETCQGISDQEFYCGVPLSLYVALFLTKDVAFLFNTVYLNVVENGF